MRTTGVAPSIDRDAQHGVKSCNCKKSNCLKLYCDCFASSSYCSLLRCNCTACFNNLESEHSRRVAVISTIERNPNAFRSKILSSSNVAHTSVNQSVAEVALHHKGCHCKKSNCLKKYCECFQLGIVCSDRCRCSNCKNFPGSVERNKCLTVGIKEISQIIRKSESGTPIGDINTDIPSSSLSASSSSSSASYSSAPSSSSDESSLVRRLDDLGSMLSHDVISKVCQTMLETVFEESKNIELRGKRKRLEELPIDTAHRTNFSSKKIKGEENIYGVDVKFGNTVTGNDEIASVFVDDIDSLPPHVDTADGSDYGMVGKLLRAFGKSVLGAVQSLTSNNDLDMSLGIAGLHSLKMERDREKEVEVINIVASTPLRARMTSAGMTGARTHLPLGPEASHPFSQRGSSILSPLVRSDTSRIFASSSLSGEEYGNFNEPEIPSTSQPSHLSRSLSISSGTTAEEKWSQDFSEEYHGSEYELEEIVSHKVYQSDIKSEDKIDQPINESKSLSFRDSILSSTPLSTSILDLEMHRPVSLIDDVMTNALSALDDKKAAGINFSDSVSYNPENIAVRIIPSDVTVKNDRQAFLALYDHEI